MDEKKSFEDWYKHRFVFQDNLKRRCISITAWKACAAHYEQQLAAKEAEIAELRQQLEAYRIIQTLPEEERIEKIIAERVRQQLEVANAKHTE